MSGTELVDLVLAHIPRKRIQMSAADDNRQTDVLAANQRSGHRICLSLLILMPFAMLVFTPARAAEFSELLRYIPQQANALVLVDAAAMFRSPLAKRSDWRSKFEDAYAASPMLLPPGANHFVMASELDFTFMVPHWEVAVMDLNTDRPMKSIAKSLNTAVDPLADLNTVRTPWDAYIVKFQDRRFGVHVPASRQAVGRWIRQVEQHKTAAVAPYLAALASKTDSRTRPLGIAIDLRDAFPEQDVRQALRQSAAATSHSLPIEQAAEAISRIKGMTLIIAIDQRVEGTLSVDFLSDVTFLGDAAKPLLLEQLRRLGASVNDLQQWDATVEGTSVQLSGTLSPIGLRKVFSIFRIGHSRSVAAAAKPDSPIPSPPESVPVRPTDSSSVRPNTGVIPTQPAPAPHTPSSPDFSKRYFQAIAGYLDEIRRDMASASSQQISLWLDSYANRIDRLPSPGVDPELLAYGRSASMHLREILAIINRTTGQAASQQAQVVPNSSVTYGMMPTWRTINYGGYRMRQYVPYYNRQVDMSGAVQKRQQIMQQAMQNIDQQTRSIAQQIADETEKIRKTMSARYNVPL